jgi:hypothetical protein
MLIVGLDVALKGPINCSNSISVVDQESLMEGPPLKLPLKISQCCEGENSLEP